MTCSTSEKAEGLAMLTDACNVIKENITKSGGNFAIQVTTLFSHFLET